MRLATLIIRTPYSLPSSAPTAYFGTANVYTTTLVGCVDSHFRAVASNVLDLPGRLLGVESGHREERDCGEIVGEWWSVISYDGPAAS